MTIVPCKDCSERHESCHSDCDKYQEWKEESDKFRDFKNVKKCYYIHNEFQTGNKKYW